MDAHETMLACRRAWDRQHWQTSLDFENPVPADLTHRTPPSTSGPVHVSAPIEGGVAQMTTAASGGAGAEHHPAGEPSASSTPPRSDVARPPIGSSPAADASPAGSEHSTAPERNSRPGYARSGADGSDLT